MFQSHSVEVRDLGRLVLRRRRIVIVSVVAFLGLALALNQFTRPVYRTATRLEIEPTPSRSPVTGAEVESPTTSSENLTLLTTAERILTRDVAEKVVREVEARGIVLDPRVVDPQQAAQFTPAAKLRANVDWLTRAVSVRPIRDTRLVDVQADYFDPHGAADLANTVAKVFLACEAESRKVADRARLASLRQQIADTRAVIEASEHSLYGSRNASLALSNERNRQLAQNGSELGSTLLKARADLRAIDAQIERIRQFKRAEAPDWSNPPVQTPALDDRYRDLQRVETQLLALRQVYRDGSPELLALESQAHALRETMRRELQKAASDLDGQREVMSARVSELDGMVTRNDRSLRALSDTSTKYSTLESELGTKRELYTMLLKKVQEQDIAMTILPPSVLIVQTAAVPLEPVRPRKLVNLIVGLVLGLVAGGGAVLALEAMRRTIRTPRDVQRELKLPVMGMIPKRTT